MKDSHAGAYSPEALKDLSLPQIRELLAQSSKLDARKRVPRLEPQQRGSALPLSYAQERLWFLDQLGLVGPAYNLSSAMRLQGSLDVKALESSFSELIRRHESLRTRFMSLDGSPIQIVDSPRGFLLAVRDLSAFSDESKESQFEQLSREEVRCPFNLATGPLLRALLVKLTSQEHALLITVHHIVADGWSLGVMSRELGAVYAAYSQGKECSLPDLPIQYVDYAIWQRQWLREDLLREHLHYWRERLEGAPPHLDLPTDRPRPAVASFRGATLSFELPGTLRKSLETLAKSEGATLFMVVLAAFQVLLSRYTEQQDVVIGFDTAGRSHVQTEGLIGFFINMIVLRTNVSGEPGFRQLLRKTKEAVLEAHTHQDLPFDKLVAELRPERNLARQPIFQVTLSLKNLPSERLHLPGLAWIPLQIEQGTAPFDLTLHLSEETEALRADFEYATDLFDRETIERMAGHFRALLERLVVAPDCSIQQVGFITANERVQLLKGFNDTAQLHPENKLIHQLFEEQARKHPGNIAVSCGDQQLSYTELNRQANQVAHALRAHGVQPDDRVALYIGRGVEMVVGLAGILKAGAAYVPLDPSYPAERLAYLLRDSTPVAVLTLRRYQGALPSSSVSTVVLFDDVDHQPHQDLDPTQLGLTAQNLAYVIYTSGSTGEPKGVMVTHRNIVSSTVARWSVYGELDRFLLLSPFGFDSSIAGIFGTLTQGGTLLVATEDMLHDLQALSAAIEKLNVTSMLCVPSLYRAILDLPGDHYSSNTLTRVIVAGEACPPALIEESLRRVPSRDVFNEYGPTEATVWATVFKCHTNQPMTTVPIGKPIGNTQIYVLDSCRQLVPIGVVGEIYIGGVGVARGYMNRAELTAARFVADPFGADPRGRLYKTGDLGRWRADGNIEYLGRNDHQVKVRGYRIELGEIEAQLVDHELINEAVVIAREDGPGNKRLVAYVIPENTGAAPTTEDLRTHLKGVLPEYMVPSAFVVLENLPLSPNGKLDRRALPAPDIGAYVSRQYEAPQGEVEGILAGIWQDLLSVERVGRWDNFFELGGHSLLIVQVMERLRQVELSAEVQRVFESPTLADLASVLTREAIRESEVPPNRIPVGCTAITPQMLPLVELQAEHIKQIEQIVPGGAPNIQDIYPLAPLQEGLLFLHLLNERGGDTYVWPTLLSVVSRQRLDELIGALQAVIERHDILRTAVLWEQLPRPVQVVYRRATLPIQEITLDPDRDPKQQVQKWMEPERQRLNLRQAPLMQLQVAADPHNAQWYVLLQLHHLTCDHIAAETIISEVIAHLERHTEVLVESIPYRNHVAQALSYARRHNPEGFFRSKLETIDEPTAPFGLVEVHGDGDRIEEAHANLEPDLAVRARAQARQLGVSAATLFHAAWALVISHTSGRDEPVFGTVLSGRVQGSAGAQQILGLFINTLPLRLRVKGVTAKELVEQTQRELVELLSHEQASLAVAQRCSGIVGSAPLFSALFNYRHSAPNADAEWNSATGIEMLVTSERSNYPITLSVDDLGEGFGLSAQVDRRIDPQRVLRYISAAVLSLVNALEKAPKTPALSLSVLPESEHHLMLGLFNSTRASYPQDELIHELFEKQAEHAPEDVALVYEGDRLTYASLNTRANQLARYLREQGVRPDQLVGICVERSVETIVGLLGILKAGGAYLPLDPNYPLERLMQMLTDAAPKVVLVQERLKEKLPASNATVISLDRDWGEITQQSSNNLDARALGLRSHNLAYVIYTSGSTGTPKGVMVEHRTLANLVHWHCTAFDVQKGSSSSSMAALGFDAATWEIWPSLSVGATLVLAPRELAADAEKLITWWSEQSLDVSFVPTPLAEFAFDRDLVSPQLRTLLVGGDRLSRRPASASFELINNYGPTETTVVATSGPVYDATSIHIGRPIANTQVYILNERQQIVPMDVSGEIYIGGAGVARGYLNRPELTADRFVADPFGADPRGRLYKTGDLGRWRADGNIEYLGRNDHQVKVRGYRIELGEIEAQLLHHALIREAVVIAREDEPGRKRLVAYVTSENAQEAPTAEELRTHLKGVLPEYMVPSAFVTLEKLPLTPNGKLDRRALPVPEVGAYVSRQYEAPQGEVEEILAGIWQGLLSVERVGRWDNFFELGGHSLLIVQVMERLRRVGLSAEVRRVFESPTLADLASALTRDAIGEFVVPPNRIPVGCEAITPEMLPLVELQAEHIERIAQAVPGGAANIQDVYPLAPLQEGLLFHHLLDERGGDAYVVPTAFSVDSRQRLDELIGALQAVIERHDVLRTAVLWEQLPQPVQVVYRRANLPVHEIALHPDRDVEEQLQDWMQPDRQRLDLRKAPMMRLQVAADLVTAQWYAVLQLHHIVDDAASVRMVISEIIAHLEGRADALPPSVPYRKHVAQALTHARRHDAEVFFRKKIGDVTEPTAPFGLVEVHGDGSQIDEAHERIAAALAQNVRVQARRLGVSVATLFHAAWSLVVAHTTGRDDVVFGSVLLGRLQGSAGAQRILGLFINTLPLRLRLRGIVAKELVEQTQRELVELLSYEQASLAVAQRCSGIVGAAPLFSSLLNYRHYEPDPEAEWNSAPGIQVIADQQRTNYPITLSVDDMGDEFGLTAQVDRQIDPRRMLSYLSAALRSLVEALEKASQTPALSLPILQDSERHRVLQLFNSTQVAYPEEKLIHELFEEQVERTPQAIAVRYEEQSLKYSELNNRANQLARHLREKGVGPDQLVGIYVERSLEMVVGLLGILKSGGAYVPLDPNYPPERLTYMLKDAAPKVLLLQERLKAGLPRSTAEVIALDRDWSEIAQQSSTNLDPAFLGLRSRHLAYLIYTSGSTGKPKGVAIEHRNTVNMICWARDAAEGRMFEQTLQSTSLNFDLSVYECFVPLTTGGSIRVVQNALALAQESTDVTLINTVPSAIEATLESARIPDTVRAVNLAGEALKKELVDRIFAASSVERVCNLYGPSETTTYSTWVAMERQAGFDRTIGRPVANTQVYILDASLQPVPIGVAGEIYIGGAGVARGYLNRPDLTAERFIPNPFGSDRYGRLYKTGDRARWQSDGKIEYLGRNDHQVKIRGFRIELGEIEAQLRQYPEVNDAAVVVREDEPGEKRLVAYVIADLQQLRASYGQGSEGAGAGAEIVDQWKKLYDETYSADKSEPGFAGWNSSYTGQPIPEVEMREWLGHTVARIQALQPKKMLEIGCGVGLLLQHLAPQCEEYVGTDFSASALEQLRRWTSQRSDLAHVKLIQRSATELQEFSAGSFDTVIINSVVQYFPDVEYLLVVLREVLRILSPGGRVFIGDVRHFGLLTTFHSAVQLSKATAAVSISQLRRRIGRAVRQERELVIDPQFFQEISASLPGIRSVEIQLKRGRAGNELTRYRYDVSLYTSGQTGNEVVCKPLEWSTDVGSIEEVGIALAARRWDAVRIASIPNGRLAQELAAQSLVETSDESLQTGLLRRQLRDVQFNDIDPEIFWKLGETYGYDVQVSWSAGNLPRCFDVQLIDRRQADALARTPQLQPQMTKPLSSYATDPLENGFRQQVIPHVRDYLKGRLPDYMIPSAWITLRQFPLTPNGKVDRRALPAPQDRPGEVGEYIAPRTDLECSLAEIWAQLLRVDRVGVQDNFFELGGHSLMATQLIVRIRSSLSIEVPMRLLFKSPTVQQFALEVDNLRQANLLESAADETSDIQDLIERVTSMSDSDVEKLVRELSVEQ